MRHRLSIQDDIHMSVVFVSGLWGLKFLGVARRSSEKAHFEHVSREKNALLFKPRHIRKLRQRH